MRHSVLGAGAWLKYNTGGAIAQSRLASVSFDAAVGVKAMAGGAEITRGVALETRLCPRRAFGKGVYSYAGKDS